MILVDTSVIIEYLRAATPRVISLIRSHDPGVCGVVQSDVLHGARTEAELQKLNKALDEFRQIATPESTWLELGRNLQAMRSRGIAVPFSDALIATLAIRDGLELWTYDAHFARMQAVLPDLRFFQEPS